MNKNIGWHMFHTTYNLYDGLSRTIDLATIRECRCYSHNTSYEDAGNRRWFVIYGDKLFIKTKSPDVVYIGSFGKFTNMFSFEGDKQVHKRVAWLAYNRLYGEAAKFHGGVKRELRTNKRTIKQKYDFKLVQ
jgi:hypothetical protein